MKQILAAMILLVFGAVNLVTELRRRRNCRVPAVATVIQVKRRRTRRSTSYTPLLAFTVCGTEYQGDGGLMGSWRRKRYQVGDTVDILYNEEDPAEFRAVGGHGMLLVALLLLALGGAMLYVALLP